MADLNLADYPNVGVTEFTLAPWGPGQTNAIAPYRPTLYPTGPVQTGWRGTLRLKPKLAAATTGVTDYAVADRQTLALVGRLRGNRHRLRVPLPAAFRGAPPPARARSSVASSRIVGESVVVDVTATGWGDWTPTPGSYLNVGERLYVLDAYAAGPVLTLVPSTEPLAVRRPRGIFPTPGGAAPAGIRQPRGLTAFRGSMYSADFTGANSHIYWVDLATGTRRRVLSTRTIRSMTTYGGVLYGNRAQRGAGNNSLDRLNLDLADPRRNTFTTILPFSDAWVGAPTTSVQGMAEWQAMSGTQADSGPKLYAAWNARLHRLRDASVLNSTQDPGTFASFFEEITGPTGFQRIDGLSAGPNPGDPLYVLDGGAGKIYTWDGVEQAEYADGTVGAGTGANIISLTDCASLEWYRGSLYVGHAVKGTTGAGIARVNIDTPATAATVEFAAPFVMARLDGGASAGLVGQQFPQISYDWFEVVD